MSRRDRQAGFTLVELMIALVLFGLLTAGVLGIAVSMGQGFREQRQVVETESAVRGPTDFIVDALRQASPGVPTGIIFQSAGDPNCNTTLGQAAINVWNGSGAGSSDLLDVVYASGGVVTTLMANPYANGTTTITVVDSTGIRTGDTLLITNETMGVLVFVSSVPNSTTINLQGQSACASALLGTTPFLPGSLVIRAMKARFSVAPDPQLPGVSTLNLTPYDQTGLNTASMQPLADNIEDLQIAQGVDTDANGIITTSAPNEWLYSPGNGGPLVGTTRALRVTVIGRAPLALQSDTGTFKRPAAEDHAVGPADSFRRRVLTSTVELRNIAGSP